MSLVANDFFVIGSPLINYKKFLKRIYFVQFLCDFFLGSREEVISRVAQECFLASLTPDQVIETYILLVNKAALFLNVKSSSLRKNIIKVFESVPLTAKIIYSVHYKFLANRQQLANSMIIDTFNSIKLEQRKYLQENSQLRSQIKEIDSLRYENSVLKSDNSRLTEDNIRLRALNETRRDTVVFFKDEISNCQQKIQEMESEVNNKTQQLDGLNETISSLTQIKAELLNEVSSKVKENSELRSEFTNRSKDYQNKIDNLFKRNKDLQNHFETIEKEANNQFLQYLSLSEEFDKYKEEYQHSVSNKERTGSQTLSISSDHFKSGIKQNDQELFISSFNFLSEYKLGMESSYLIANKIDGLSLENRNLIMFFFERRTLVTGLIILVNRALKTNVFSILFDSCSKESDNFSESSLNFSTRSSSINSSTRIDYNKLDPRKQKKGKNNRKK